MNYIETAIYAAKLGDLLHEAKTGLGPEQFADMFELAAAAIAKHVSDALKRRWMSS